MILIDFSQLCYANIIVQSIIAKDEEINLEMFRHMVLNSIRKNIREFRPSYGNDIVIACDSYGSWRKKYFPNYKAGRKEGRDEGPIDWSKVFEWIGILKSELKTYFPYRVIDIPGCEGDDVIAALVNKFGQPLAGSDNILILSGDKDFRQLHKYGNVFQYDPVNKKKITISNAHEFLLEHIIRGDKTDGVPNILSPDNTFVDKKRSTTLSKKRYDEIINKIRNNEYNTVEYHRNKMLIDLDNTPSDLVEKIFEEYDAQGGKTKQRVLTYLVNNRLTKLVEMLGDF